MAVSLVRAGYNFVGRYYKPQGVEGEGKPVYNYKSAFTNLTAQEARDICNAGLSIVALWEYGSDPTYFTEKQNVLDAETALAHTAAAGQPSGGPIYFTVDANIAKP